MKTSETTAGRAAKVTAGEYRVGKADNGPYEASYHGDSLIITSKDGWITGQVGGNDRHANARLLAASWAMREALREGLRDVLDAVAECDENPSANAGDPDQSACMECFTCIRAAKARALLAATSTTNDKDQ